MEISPFEIYMVMQADSVRAMLVALTIMLSIAVLVTFVATMVANDAVTTYGRKEDVEARNKCWKVLIKLTVATITMWTMVALMPTTKTIVYALSVPVAIDVADELQLDETARKTVTAVNKLLDKYALEEDK